VELIKGLQPPSKADMASLFRDDAAWGALSDAVAPLFHPDFAAVAATGLVQSYRGLDGLRALWLDWMGPWETYRTEVEDAIDRGDEVLLLVRDYGRREGMDAEVRVLGAAVWTIAEGKITRAVFYNDRAEALEAVGLPE
jgi:ketosteroid isomerase-like protein